MFKIDRLLIFSYFIGLAALSYNLYTDIQIYRIISVSIFILVSIGLFARIFIILKNNKGLIKENTWLKEKTFEKNYISYQTKNFTEILIDKLPYAIISINESFEIVYYSDKVMEYFPNKKNYFKLEDISADLSTNISEGLSTFTIEIDQKYYNVFYESSFNTVVLYDVDAYYKLERRYKEKKLALAMIRIDYYDELISTKDVKTRAEIQGLYYGIIAQYANSKDVMIQPISEDTFLFVMDNKQMNLMVEEGFTLLDDIRNANNKIGFKVTISAGVASYENENLECYQKMIDALDLAESRGGDQAVIDIEGKEIEYIGGTVEAAESRSKIRSRIMAGRIKGVVLDFDDIYIMGHRMSDSDALGAMIGMAFIVRTLGKSAKMIIQDDLIDKTAQDLFKFYPDNYKDNIVSPEYVTNNLNENSLVIVVDFNNEAQAMVKDVVSRTKNVFVIDHHRKKEDTYFDIIEAYIEPYASSTSELVTELINFTEGEYELSPEEATIIYAGLIVDTNNFQTKTGSRTFEVASYLRALGADINHIKLLLRSDFHETIILSKLIAASYSYLDKYMICASNEMVDEVINSKVANKLLDIIGVDASFVVTKSDENSYKISARSLGSINVQTIMERLGGGGHFASSATKYIGSSLKEIIEVLENVIKESEENNGNNTIR